MMTPTVPGRGAAAICDRHGRTTVHRAKGGLVFLACGCVAPPSDGGER